MGKSSSSLKKKRSKKSSKVRASSKSKSRRYKSKKLQCREVCLSSSEYSDSASLESSFSSSSEDSYRSRRAWSSKRKDEKGRRKMAKRHSFRPESSEDTLHDRKRKRAKIKKKHNVREKPYKKKKLRKEASVNSMSSGSWSCSTCQGESASSDEGEPERHRGRAERKGKYKGGVDRGRSGIERGSRYRAKSCSSCSFSSESGDKWTEEKYVSKNNSRWLRSVITVTEEAGELCRDETKEEIVDDHDYPCRSNDSNDGGSKKESDHHLLPASRKEAGVVDKKLDSNADFDLREPKTSDQSYDDRSQYDRSQLDVYDVGTSQSVEKKTSETSGASLTGNDIESILRQRALENLRKFRGEIQSSAKVFSQKIKIDNDVNQPTIENHELVHGMSIVNNAGEGENFDKKTLVKDNLPAGGRNSVASSGNNESNLNGVKAKSVSVKRHSTCAPEKLIAEIIAENPSETITGSTNYMSNSPKLKAMESFHHSLKCHPSLNQTPASGGHEKSVVTEGTIDRNTSDSAHFEVWNSNDGVVNIGGLSSASLNPSCSMPNFTRTKLNKEQDEVKEHSQFELKQTSDSHEPCHTECPVTVGNEDQNAAKTDAAIESISRGGRDVDKLCVSTTAKAYSESSSVDNSSNQLQGEANQGSQFEQKTMNVMRGGEMVQVSYKVYIPKKTPALARRQLKR